MLYLNLIFSVSITGTVPFCIYLLFKKFFDIKMRASFQYRLLKGILFCYVCPFALLKSLITNSIAPKASFTDQPYIYLDNKIVQNTSGFHMRPAGNLYKILIPAGLLVILLVICYQLYRYVRFRHKCLCQLKPDDRDREEFIAQKTRMGIKRPVSLLYCDAAVSPFTCGVFRPCVVITSIVPADMVPMAIGHELQHIKSHDFLFRKIAFLIVLLHCWNPFIYLLWNEFCEVQELACDEKVTQPYPPEKVWIYGDALLRTAMSAKGQSSFLNHFSEKNKKVIYRRVRRMSVHPQKRSKRFGICVFLSCLCGFAITVAAVAPEVVHIDLLEDDEISTVDWVYMANVDENALPCPEDELHFRYTDQYLLFEDGTIVDAPISLEDTSEAMSCSHVWKTAEYKKHEQDNKGGCMVYTYNIYGCAKCGAIRGQTLIGENHYLVCPHQ